MPRVRRWTDAQLREVVPRCQTLIEVCGELGVPPGGKTYFSLRRAIERLSIDASHLPRLEPQTKRRRRRFSDEELAAAVADSCSLAEVMRVLGYSESGGIHRFLRAHIVERGLDTSHFRTVPWNKGKRWTNPPNARPLDEILVVGSSYPSGKLRERLVKAGLKEPRCECCGLDEW